MIEQRSDALWTGWGGPVPRQLAHALAHQCFFIPAVDWAEVVRRSHVLLRGSPPQQMVLSS